VIDRYASIVPAAAAVIHGPGDKVAFVRQQRGPFAGNWLLPGGGIEIGESPAQAVIREIQEEIGLTVVAPRLFGLYEITGTHADRRFHIMLFTLYALTTQRVPEGFAGHNVSAIAQSVPGALCLHSTDLRILSDAGILSVSDAEVAAALCRDGLVMRAYKFLPSTL
jgi:8-oxo-dGTP diphosphatase